MQRKESAARGRLRAVLAPKGGVRAQLIAILLTLTLLATSLTGWMIYERAADQLIEDAWTQNQALLETALAAVNRQIEQMRSFSWQLSNHNKIVTLLYARDQTPENILVKRDLIDLLQGMKAFSDTLSDIGIYLPVSNRLVTAESSYRTEEYFARLSDAALTDITRVREAAGGSALSAYVGRYNMERIISRDDVLLFVTDLPVGRKSALGFAFFQLRVDKLRALLPGGGMGTLLLTDATGEPLTSESLELRAICRLAQTTDEARLTYQGQEYGVLQAETDEKGLRCMAVAPYSTLLTRATEMRSTTMLVMGACIAMCLLASVWATRRLYRPIEGLMDTLVQLGHALPEKGERNEFALLGDALHMVSEQNRRLRLSNRQINRLLKNRLLNDLMEGRLNAEGSPSLREAGVTLEYASAQVAVIELDTDAHGLRRLSEALGQDAADWVEGQRQYGAYGALEVWCALREDRRLLVLFNIDAKHPHPEVIYDYLTRCHDALQAHVPCRIGVGRAYRLIMASNSLVDAMLALRSDARDGVRLAEEANEPPDTEYTLAAEQQLMNQAMSGQKDEVRQLLWELCEPEERADERRSPVVIPESLVQALLFTARRVARQADVEPIYLESLQREGLRARDLPREERTLEKVRDVFFAVMDGVRESRGTQDERLYGRLLEYIRTEYMHDISLDTASAALSLSPSYIGLIFRRAGGASFARTVTEVRVTEAKRLLRQTELNVREIGERVGLGNQNTFIRVFKKAEGVTPGQFRLVETTMDSHN